MINKNFIKVKDLYFIFNTNKTAWIAVTPDALEFCNKYIDNKNSINCKTLSPEERNLFDGLNKLVEENLEFCDEDEYKSCYIHITQNCNLKCPYCYSKDSMRNKFQDLDLDSWKKAIKKVKAMGFNRLVFSGGEPLLYTQIDELLSYCNELQFEEIDLISNGLLVNKRNIVFLKENVKNLCISLDGYNEETNCLTRGAGNFEKVVDSIKMLRENEVAVNIIATIYKENINDINEYINLASSLDCTVSFSLFTVSGEAKNNQQLQQTETQLTGLSEYLLDDDTPQLLFDNVPIIKGIQYREGCGAGNYLISINADGNVYPCHFMMQEPLLMGNIFEDSIENILDAGKLHSSQMNVENIHECNSCDFKHLCGGGCRANTYKGKGKVKCSDDCKFYKSYYEKIVEEFM
ncbi:MAG: radical SAM protein [Oscillospiraceae bacterium]